MDGLENKNAIQIKEKGAHIKRTLRALMLIAGGLLVSSLPPHVVLAQETTAPAAPVLDQSDQLLDKALQSIQAGNPQTAIDQYLDPLIAEFEKLAKPEGPQLYSADTMAEVILYSARNAAAAKKGETPRDSTIVSGAWSSALHLKGYALVDLERYEDAKATLRHGLEIAPMNPVLWNELGAVLQLEKNWPEAMDAYEHAESGASLFEDLDSKQVNGLLTRALRGQGYVLIETGELKKAEKIYQRCLKLDPDDEGAKRELVYINNLKAAKKTR